MLLYSYQKEINRIFKEGGGNHEDYSNDEKVNNNDAGSSDLHRVPLCRIC